jgi:hypothetical protein
MLVTSFLTKMVAAINTYQVLRNLITAKRKKVRKCRKNSFNVKGMDFQMPVSGI